MSIDSKAIAEKISLIKGQKEDDKKNGIARPLRGTSAGVWAICDELYKQLGRVPYRQEVAEEADKFNFPRPTVFTNYGYWRVYMGFGGYISRQPGQPMTVVKPPLKEPSPGVKKFLKKAAKVKAKNVAKKEKIVAKAKAKVAPKKAAKKSPKKVVKAPEPGPIAPPPLG